MAIFSPMDVNSPALDRRKQLVNRVMQQYNANQNTQAGYLTPPPLGGVQRLSGGGMGGAPFTQVTHGRDVAPGLSQALGPGGFGAPGLFDASMSRGAPISLAPMSPHLNAQTAPALGGIPAPMMPDAGPATPGAPPSNVQTGDFTSPQQTAQGLGLNSVTTPNNAAGAGGTLIGQDAKTPGGFNGGSPSMIHLGNGVYYDPVNDWVTGHAIDGGLGSAARAV